jgi:hypothetical protein
MVMDQVVSLARMCEAMQTLLKIVVSSLSTSRHPPSKAMIDENENECKEGLSDFSKALEHKIQPQS